jgi:hypothetical protein
MENRHQTSDFLHLAVANPNNGKAEISKLLQEYQLDVNGTQNPNIPKPVCYAAKFGSFETLQFLIDECHADLHMSKSENLFIYAVKRPEFLIYLADPHKKIYEKFKDQTTALTAAVVRKDWDGVKKELKAYPKLVESKISDLITTFFWVGVTGSYTMLENLFLLPLFKNQPTRKHFLRGVCHGLKRRGELYTEDTTRQGYDEAVLSFEKVIFYLNQIPFKSDMDLVMLNEVSPKLIKLYLKQIEYLKQNYLYSESLKVVAKRIHCQKNLFELQKLNDVRLNEISESRNHRNEMIAAAADWGFGYHEIMQDGNCFFHAICHQADIHNIGLPVLKEGVALHQFYRMKALEIMHEHMQYYAQFFDHTNQDFNKYLTSMAIAGEWADNLIITAMVDYLQVTLVVVKGDGTVPHIIKSPNSTNTLYIGYEGNNHYVSLIQLDLQINSRLQQLIDDEKPMDITATVPALTNVISADVKPVSKPVLHLTRAVSNNALSHAVIKPLPVASTKPVKVEDAPLLQRASFDGILKHSPKAVKKPGKIFTFFSRFLSLPHSPTAETVAITGMTLAQMLNKKDSAEPSEQTQRLN